MRNTVLAAIAALALSASAFAEVRGSYIESRNAEIYASHCFANSEAGIRGDFAVMAWKIDRGVVDGVSIDNLGVVAVVRASATLGDPFANPLPAKAVLIVDERADQAQQAALADFARNAAGELVADIVRTETAPIVLDFHGDLHDKIATLTAGKLVRLETRAIEDTDSLCHLDNIYYAPLVNLDHAMPAFSKVFSFHGQGLDRSFDDYKRSSVYIGMFAVSDQQLSDD